MKEREIRTPSYKLLFCKAIVTEEDKLVLELKNGKRIEQVPAETFFAEINRFMKESASKLHIEIK